MTQHFLELTATQGARIGAEGGADAVQRLGPEAANIEAFLCGPITRELVERAVAAALGLGELAVFTGLGGIRPVEAAADLAHEVGDVLGEANCIKNLGDILLARSDHEVAHARYEEALPLYRRVGSVLAQIPEPYSVGWTHVRLARLSAGDDRNKHLQAARAAWEGIKRPDLIERMDREFGLGVAAG